MSVKTSDSLLWKGGSKKNRGVALLERSFERTPCSICFRGAWFSHMRFTFCHAPVGHVLWLVMFAAKSSRSKLSWEKIFLSRLPNIGKWCQGVHCQPSTLQKNHGLSLCWADGSSRMLQPQCANGNKTIEWAAFQLRQFMICFHICFRPNMTFRAICLWWLSDLINWPKYLGYMTLERAGLCSHLS